MSVDVKELIKTSKTINLLYVEDDEQVRDVTLRLLLNFFESITVAVDGKDGIEKYQDGNFDLIITDISMPKMSGIDMIKIIREENSSIPIMLLSAYSDSDKFMQAIELDIDSYVLKPIIYDKFIKTLQKSVEKIKLLRINENYKKDLEEEVERRNAEIEYKLHFDALTNLYSRYTFFRDIESFTNPLIILIDIDKFRVINEVYGSSVGSKVLEKFARIFKNTVKDTSYKLYRVSADEFALIDTAENNEVEKYELYVKELFEKLDNLEIDVDGNIIRVDITIGVSMVEKNGYESAKIALDYAKKNKKTYVMYSNDIDYRKESSITLKCRDNISLAIDEDRVVAVFQPIVDKDGKIIKYETLMRLREKETPKLMSPVLFLDVAVKTRLYENLSTKIIFKALNVLNEKNTTLSINFTYSDIKNTKLIGDIEEFLSVNNQIGERVVFEITENESIENYDDMKNFIQRFRKYGVKIAIDDFGTGFSNFKYILEIAPDYLKIDGSLVKDIDTDLPSRTLVEAIVQFSHKLGIKVIAEYVHSETIFLMLKGLDVDEYQGYYFSEPLEKIME